MADKHDNRTLCYCYTGSRIIHIFPVPGSLSGNKCCFYGRFIGATLSGVTFPVSNMYPLVRDASYLFPVRHFTEMIQTMLYGGGGFIYLWPSMVILCIFPLLALSLLPHLKRAIESHKYENIK